METKKIYEYIVVARDWFGNLEKGSRLYYDYNRGGYIYFYESERTDKNSRYETKSFETMEYFISPTVSDVYLKNGELIAGPELGMLEFKE